MTLIHISLSAFLTPWTESLVLIATQFLRAGVRAKITHLLPAASPNGTYGEFKQFQIQ